MTEQWQPQPAIWYLQPRPWTCSRCGKEFGMEDWTDYFRQWLTVDQIDPYGPPLCHHCFAVKRLLGVLQDHEVEFGMVEPCEPGKEINTEIEDDDDQP